MVSVSQLIGHVEMTAGGPISDALGGSIAIVNAAGRHLFACREWFFASRATATLSTVSGRDYMLLPANFAALNEADLTSGLQQWSTLTTMNEILDLRSRQGTATSTPWRVAVNWRVLGTAITGLTTDTLQPVLEVWPTPTSSEADKFTVLYKSRWPDQTDDGTVVLIPQFVEPLLIDFCRAFARGYEAEEQGSLTERLGVIQTGAVYAAAVQQDDATQRNLGPMRNGLLDGSRLMGDDWISGYTITL